MLERRGLAVWVEEGVLILLKESATVRMAKGYGLAPYELSDLRMSTDEKVDLAA